MGTLTCWCRDLSPVFNLTLAPSTYAETWFAVSNFTYTPLALLVTVPANSTGGCVPYCDNTLWQCEGPFSPKCSGDWNYHWAADRPSFDPFFDAITATIINWAGVTNRWANTLTAIVFGGLSDVTGQTHRADVSSTVCSTVLAESIAKEEAKPANESLCPVTAQQVGCDCNYIPTRMCEYSTPLGMQTEPCPCGGVDPDGNTLVPIDPTQPACPFADCVWDGLESCVYYFIPRPNFFTTRILFRWVCAQLLLLCVRL